MILIMPVKELAYI